MVQETVLRPQDLIQPFFIKEGATTAIDSMPGVSRLSLDDLIKESQKTYDLGIPAVILFPVIETKSDDEILNPDGLLPKTVKALKKHIPELCVIADIALDPYSTHGHDGIVVDGKVLNDESAELFAKTAVMLGAAGADMVAPSDMMDGRVGIIRQKLDSASLKDVSIMSYSAKYASSLYGPFRDALNSAPRFGDKKTYQMDPANWQEALLECALDEEEGADILMVKPALSYLDVISRVREQTTLPLAAYHVSGEYSMVMAAAEKGWLDAEKVLLEQTLAIKRAGADLIITYAAHQLSVSDI